MKKNIEKELLDKIEQMNAKVAELGIDARIETRPSMRVYVLIHEVGSDIGDEVFAVFDNIKEAEECASRCNLYRWRVEDFKMTYSEN